MAELKKNENQEPEVFRSRHSNWKYASNGLFQVVVSLMSSAQGIYLYFYYYNVLGLDNGLIVLAMTIFTVYDAINDPIMGFLMDRNFKWTRKWGRRFPWIVIGIIPWCLSLYLIFSAPDINAAENPWPVFIWLLISLVIFDTCGSLIGINVMALRPDLFREESERQKFTYFWTFFDIAAVAIGMLVPPMFLGTGNNRNNFALMGGMVAVIALVAAIFFLPGAREDKVVIDRYFTEESTKPFNLFSGFKEVLKLRSFVIYFIALNSFSMATGILMTMGPYVNNFLLRGAPGDEVMIYAIFLSGTLVSIPLWIKYLKKVQNAKRVLTIGGFTLSFSFIFLTFFVGPIDLYVIFFVCGLAMGSMWAFFYTIIQANVVDDFVAKTKTNQKGVLLGVSVLLGRLVATVDEGIIALIQDLTNFPERVTNYSELEIALSSSGADINVALNGIRIMLGIIPAVILFIGTFIFWKFYPLTPEKVKENKQILKELNL